MRKLVKNSLGYDNDLYVYQDKTMFNYSVDTILLGNFVALNSSIKRILEIGANNGALSIFIAARNQTLQIDAIEIQPRAVAIARKNVALNQQTNQINLISGDFITYAKNAMQKNLKYDAIVCNPPFYKAKSALRRQASAAMLIATHEIKITLEAIIAGAATILKQKGYLTLVHTTERFVDIVTLMRQYQFEPKRIQMVYPRENSKSNLVLVEGRYKSNAGTHFLPNIYLHPNDQTTHQYRPEVKKLYHPKKEQYET